MTTTLSVGYHHNDFVATHELGHMKYGYTLLVPMNQRMLNKLSKERNIIDPRDTERSNRSKTRWE